MNRQRRSRRISPRTAFGCTLFLLFIYCQFDSPLNLVYYGSQRIISLIDSFKTLEAPVPSDKGPKIALLMTFPGAGTTYTTYLVKKASGTVSATNYGNEYLDHTNQSLPLYSDIPGPYLWQDENLQGLQVPSTYILTKTHCGGRCQDCPPLQYMETVYTFMRQCVRAPRVVSREYLSDIQKEHDFTTGEVKEMEVAPGVLQPFLMQSYDPKLVQKMVHVVKSPFSNVVSRFHHEYKSIVQKFNVSEGFEYTYDPDGFQAWCRLEDGKFVEEEIEAYGESIYELTKNVPCHADFYRYVQWHNLASDTAEKLNIEPYEFNHEDYGYMMKERVTGLLEYLELPFIDGDLKPFKQSESYDYFTEEQMKAIAIFIRALANERTWSLVCGYLPDENIEHAFVFHGFSRSRRLEKFCPMTRFVDMPRQVEEPTNQVDNVVGSSMESETAPSENQEVKDIAGSTTESQMTEPNNQEANNVVEPASESQMIGASDQEVNDLTASEIEPEQGFVFSPMNL